MWKNKGTCIVISIVWYIPRIMCKKFCIVYIVSAYELYDIVSITYESYYIIKSYISYNT